ncbi:MAG: phospho-N-acetylmuramoyl-pentapeptide-transferase [Candidatus Omnitrophica bacterium]|nr:phospho-N-acetylmuramoyl-pentapeptide-transferase [Candidatus Omnitrophota bacterium]
MFYFLSQFRFTYFPLNIFRYITFRAGMAAVTTFLLCVIIGPWFIRKLKEWNFGEKPVMGAGRGDVLGEHLKPKQGTPTMGGILIVGSILLSVLLWSDVSNRYILLTIFTMLWLAVVGFIDDYLKITGRSKNGMSSRTKLIWQVLLAAIVSFYIYTQMGVSTTLDVPFLKRAMVDLGAFYFIVVMLIVVGTSNAVNLTDGLDGLAIGCTLMVALPLSIMCYVTGHVNFSQYLLIPYLPGAGELTIFCMAIVGASLGFLWFNAHPASVFMGDVGALALGGTLGIISVFIKKEFLMVILGGVFVWEALSVIIQVTSFKLTGKRVFLCSPYHHHLQKLDWKESKIVIRFWIVGIILALVTLTTLKMR